MIINNFFLFLHPLTCLALLFFDIKLFTIKNKNKIQRCFLLTAICAFIWSNGVLLQVYAKLIFGHFYWLLVDYYSIGMYLFPNFALLFVISLVRPDIKFNFKYLLFFIVPIVRFLFVLTNKYHHLCILNMP